MKTLLTILNAKFIQSSLAIRCLTTACAHRGVAVDAAEYTINQNPYDILRHIAAFKADVIGFSCYIWNIEMTCHIITLVKSVFPETKIFVAVPKSPIRPAGSFLTARISTMSSRAKGKSWCRIF